MCKKFYLKRRPENPIITPKDFPGAEAVFNCGQTMYNGKTILLLSIIFKDSPPKIHIAESKDGINFTINPEPFITSETAGEFADLNRCAIDARVTHIEDTYYIIHPGGNGPELSVCAFLGKTKDFKKYEFMGIIALPSNRVPCLFPEKINGLYVRIDRPGAGEVCAGMWLSYSPDLIYWGRNCPLLKPWGEWAGGKIGPTPPIKTEQGWLVIIHGMNNTNCGFRYCISAILLDLNDPSKVMGKTSPILAPEEPYELEGRVPNVVFPCGAVVDPGKDEIRVYYGAADTCIGLATGSMSKLVNACQEGD